MDSESESDDWCPTPAHPTLSLFNKMTVNFTNHDIQQNIENMLSHPNYFDDGELDPEDRPAQPQAHQALYNPLEDDENLAWMQKLTNTSQTQKPLTCPHCFSQLAYKYKKRGEDMFQAENVINLVVQQTKVIRNRQIPQRMQLSLPLAEEPALDPSMGSTKAREAQISRLLIEREQQINVKIVCTCECGIDIGYYDVNKALYVLCNVV